MHIPDGYLSPQTYVVLDAAIVPLWVIAARKLKRTLRARQVPLLALGAAFAFVIMMFNVPVLGGSTGHAVGATLIAIVLGPWAALIAVSIAVVIQALVFGDGGITAIGANCVTMAVVAPFVGFYVYRLLAGDEPSGRRRTLASGAGAYVGLVAASVCAGVMLGLQPWLAHTSSGQALYAPYPLAVAVPAMALEHLLFFGVVEALVTMGVVTALSRSDARLLEMRPAARPLRWLWAGIAVLIVLTPLGTLAGGAAWGEWSSTDLKRSLGYAPAGMARLGGAWKAVMPGYATPGLSDAALGYLLAAVVGVGLCVVLAWVLGAVLARGGATAEPPPRPAPPTAPPTAPPALREPSGHLDIAPAASHRRHRRSLALRTAGAIGRAAADVLENEAVAARPGLLQRLDPRVKLVTLLLFAVTASLVHSLWVLAALVVLPLALAAASRVDVGRFALRVWASAGLLALLIALPSATRLITPGAVVVSLGPLSLTRPGLLGVVTLVLRAVACAEVALLVMTTARWSDLLHALTALGMPDVVVATLAMTQKQILTLLRTVQQIHLARESRTLTFGTTRANRTWVTERMAFVLRKSLKTADDVYDAMLARGFAGAMHGVAELRLRGRDWSWSAFALAVCATALVADRMVPPR